MFRRHRTARPQLQQNLSEQWPHERKGETIDEGRGSIHDLCKLFAIINRGGIETRSPESGHHATWHWVPLVAQAPAEESHQCESISLFQ